VGRWAHVARMLPTKPAKRTGDSNNGNTNLRGVPSSTLKFHNYPPPLLKADFLTFCRFGPRKEFRVLKGWFSRSMT